MKKLKKGMLNIPLLAIRLPPHSSSSSECAKRKAYNEMIQFAQTIIQVINITKTSIVEFLCKSKQCWRARKQTKPSVKSIDSMCIEKSEENEAKEQHFVEAQTM